MVFYSLYNGEYCIGHECLYIYLSTSFLEGYIMGWRVKSICTVCICKKNERESYCSLVTDMLNLPHLQVPWTDLRYLFGDIMYGGHITDDWDRRLCRTYLAEYMKPELVSPSA